MLFNVKKINFCILFSFAVCSLWLSSCQTIDLYEKVVSVPKHQWQSNFKPQFKFTIKDTAASYQLYIVLRHNDQYSYNNIWLNLYAQAPEDKQAQKFMLELPLASDDRWLGVAMDDLYEHRIALTLDPEKFNFKKTGSYTFIIEQVMRQNPLENILNIGLRIEKKPQ